MTMLQGLVSNEGLLYAIWKGIPGDERIFYSILNGSGIWSPHEPMQGLTCVGPSATVFNGAVYAAWRGVQNDPRMFYAVLGTNGIWSPQAEIPQAYSDVGPALGAIGSTLVAVWKNAWDQSLLYAVLEGRNWSTPALFPGGSSVGPSLALYNGKLYAAWKGANADEALYYNVFNGSVWSAQTLIPGVASSVGPSLAAVGTNLYAVWKGAGTDQALYWSWFNGESWAPQSIIPGGNSSEGAALSAYNGLLYALWKGEGTDNSLWMSHLNGTTWAAPSKWSAGGTGQDSGSSITLPALSSGNNLILIDVCQNLQNLTVTVNVTQDLITAGDTGFSLQLNAYPQTTSSAQGQTLNWLQYILYVGFPTNNLGWEIQYWDVGAQPYSSTQVWPPGHVPIPANSTPWLPALPNDFHVQPFGPAPANRLLAGSVMKIQLTTNAAGAVISADFYVTDPKGNLSHGNFPFPANARFPIYGFQVDLVGPGGNASCNFLSGAGTILYTVSAGTLAVQSTTTCGGSQPGTAESSNATYGPLSPSSGSAVSQGFNHIW